MMTNHNLDNTPEPEIYKRTPKSKQAWDYLEQEKEIASTQNQTKKQNKNKKGNISKEWICTLIGLDQHIVPSHPQSVHNRLYFQSE